jgi:hypothetical protein
MPTYNYTGIIFTCSCSPTFLICSSPTSNSHPRKASHLSFWGFWVPKMTTHVTNPRFQKLVRELRYARKQFSCSSRDNGHKAKWSTWDDLPCKVCSTENQKKIINAHWTNKPRALNIFSLVMLVLAGGKVQINRWLPQIIWWTTPKCLVVKFF